MDSRKRKVSWCSLKSIQISLQNKTAEECHEYLQASIKQSISKLSISRLAALSSLLDEKFLTFDQAFDEYIGKIPPGHCAKDLRSAKKRFQTVLLSHKGLPVIILQNYGMRYESFPL